MEGAVGMGRWRGDCDGKVEGEEKGKRGTLQPLSLLLKQASLQ